MIPEGWGNSNIGELVDILPGYAFKSANFSNDLSKGKPIIRIRNIQKQFPKTVFAGDYLDAYLVNSEDILIGMDGDFHICRWNGPESLLNQRVCKIWSKKQNELDDLFLFYRLQPELINLNNSIAGTTVKHLSTKHLRNLEFPLPPLPEQKKIATILSSVDDTIQATQAVIDQTRRVKQGLMQQLLTCGIEHTRFKQTEIGEIPEEWDIIKLGDVADESKKRFVPNGNEIYTYVGLEHMESGMNRIGRTGLSSDVTSSKTVFKAGDTLFGKLRPYLKKVSLSDTFGVCSTDIIAIRPSEQIDPYFLCTVLSSDSAIAHSIESSAGTKMPRTSWKEMSSFNFLLPKIIEQKKIAAILKSFDETFQIEQAKLQQNIKIKNGLMQDLLTGRVRVKPDEVDTT